MEDHHPLKHTPIMYRLYVHALHTHTHHTTEINTCRPVLGKNNKSDYLTVKHFYCVDLLQDMQDKKSVKYQ